MEFYDIELIYDIIKNGEISLVRAINADTLFTDSAIIFHNSILHTSNHVVKCLLRHILNRIMFLKFLLHELCKKYNIFYNPKEVNFIVPDITETFITSEYIEERCAIENLNYPDKALQNILFANYTILRRFYYYIEVIASCLLPNLSPTELENIVTFGTISLF